MFDLFAQKNLVLISILILIWTIPWKGVALWRAAQSRHKIWFVSMLILNTLAILEIIYIFFFSKKNIDNSDLEK